MAMLPFYFYHWINICFVGYIIIQQSINNYRHYIVIIFVTMDFGFDKRMQFRQSIRRRKIQQIKKTKRQLYQQYYEQHKQQFEQQVLYQKIVNNSNKIFEEGEKYLQMLSQAVNWQKSNKLKHMFSEVLLNIIKYYEDNQPSQEAIKLIIECIATIYYYGRIEFDSITKRTFLICYQQLMKNKIGHQEINLIKNRSLIAILNITSTQNKEVLKVCEDICLLQKLEQMVEDFPTEDFDKVNIMGIYANIINYHLQYHSLSYNQPPQYYPQILKHCIEQNFNSQVLNKAVETIINLLNSKFLDKLDVLLNIQSIYFLLLQAGFYVEDSETLLGQTFQFFLDEDNLQNNLQFLHTIFSKLEDLLQLLLTKYTQSVTNSAIGKCLYYMGLISIRYFEQTSQAKLEDLTRKACNFWVDIQDDSTHQLQIYFLKLLYQSLKNCKFCQDLQKEQSQGQYQQNAIRASTWEIINQFLCSVRLQEPNKMWSFLNLLSLQHLFYMIDESHRPKLYEKIEGCFYDASQNDEIRNLAEKLLKNYFQNQNHQ